MHCWNLTRGGVHPRVSDLPQPGSYPCVGRVTIDPEPLGAQLAGEWYIEAGAQIADEALDLALGARPIRLTEAWPETVVMGEVEEGPIVAMLAWPVGLWLI